MPNVADRPMTVRLPAWLDEELRQEFAERDEGPSEGLRRVLEEWWVRTHLSAIQFREGISGRRAAVEDGPEVWEIVTAARAYGEDRRGLREHFGWLEEESLEGALDYYERFPGRVDALIEENERIARRLAERLG